MRRTLLALVVGVLALSASNISSLVIAEPCTGVELPGQADSTCPPTCVTCGCCAQGVEPVSLAPEESQQVHVASVVLPFPPLSSTDPRDILHVPKPRLI